MPAELIIGLIFKILIILSNFIRLFYQITHTLLQEEKILLIIQISSGPLDECKELTAQFTEKQFFFF